MNEKYMQQKNMAIVSLIMGIFGIVTSCCCYLGVVCGILGIVFAILSRTEKGFEGYSIAGLVTSIIAVVIACLIGIFYIGISILGA